MAKSELFGSSECQHADAGLCAIAKAAKEGKTALVLVEDESVGTRLVRDINEITGDKIAVLFPSRDFNFLPVLAQNNEYEQARIAV